jgi:hypothetical protein
MYVVCMSCTCLYVLDGTELEVPFQLKKKGQPDGFLCIRIHVMIFGW